MGNAHKRSESKRSREIVHNDLNKKQDLPKLMIQDFMMRSTSKANATPTKTIPRSTKHKNNLSLTNMPPLLDNGSKYIPTEFFHNLGNTKAYPASKEQRPKPYFNSHMSQSKSGASMNSLRMKLEISHRLFSGVSQRVGQGLCG